VSVVRSFNINHVLFDYNLGTLIGANLDHTDLRILNMLARNGRLSYWSIGIAIGLTTKSVKARVDKMVSSRIIDRFLTIINPSIFGFSGTYVVALKKRKLNKDLLERISLVGVIGYRFEVLGGVMGLGIGIKEEDEEKIQKLLDSLRPTIVGIIESRNYEVPDILSKSDYAIIKELIRNPRIEVIDIAKETSISPKTIRKRMEKMTRNRVLEFSINVDPSAMKGQIVFFLSVIAEKEFYPRLLERILSELHDNMILSFNLANQVNAIGLNLAVDDIFKIERIRARIESFDGVQEANVFFPIKLECPQEWVIKMIDHKLKKDLADRSYAQITVSETH
jgi:DNA-binding Lrp family transcriptional regulator